MKKCSYCGKEYPDEAMRCAVDAELLVPLGSQGPALPAEEPMETPAPATDAAQMAARKNMFVGALWFGGGLLVTGLTYGAASSGPGGGSYVVAWGAIVFGALQFFRGVAGSVANRGQTKPPTTAEAGLRVPATPPTPPKIWKCATCGQELEPQFTSCWKCRAPRDGPAP